MTSRKDLKEKLKRRTRRRRSIRSRVFGTPQKPRLTVFRSHKQIYCQLIDDFQGLTLASASTRCQQVAASLSGKPGNCEAAKAVGKVIAERALAKGVQVVQFDRNGYRYHGRIKALAEAAREGGLQL